MLGKCSGREDRSKYEADAASRGSRARLMSETRKIDRIEGCGIPLRGNNIDTDRIIPARFLKAITFEGLGEHAFEDDRQAMPDHPFSNTRFRQATILLVNQNFGSGSSREHAPQALQRWGIAACVGESFSEIFQGNAVSIGLACATTGHVDMEFLIHLVEEAPDTQMALTISQLSLRTGDRTISLEMPGPFQLALLNGLWDATGLLLDRFDDVRAVAERLPYVTGPSH